MADNRYIDFLNKLINETKEKKINWKYLDSNKSLYEGMNWTYTSTEYSLFVGEKEKLKPNFNSNSQAPCCLFYHVSGLAHAHDGV